MKLKKPQYRTVLGLRDLRPAIKSNPTYIEPVYDENIQGRVLLLDDWKKTPDTWFDHSGTGNNGTVYGAGTPPPATPQALGYLFDGVDDYVDCGAVPNLNFGTEPFTISAWFKVPAYGNMAVVSKGFGQAGTAYPGYMIRLRSDSGIMFTAGNGSENGLNVGNYGLNSWVNIVAVRNSTSRLLYYNGAFIGSDNIILNANTGISSKIGASYSFALTNFFNGTIDEVRIYNRALSPNEIWSHYIKYKGKFGF